jgi:acetyl-CoA acyltransferase
MAEGAGPGPRPARSLRDVVVVDAVRTPFGRAGSAYGDTRADDLIVRCLRELLRRNPGLAPADIEEVAIAATTQTGDQGLTLGRSAGILAGLPRSVPGYAIDRMCAGALTAVTTTASSIAVGAIDVALAGGVEHMGHHPMGEGMEPNPRFVAEKLVDPSALVMGQTAENLHDQYPQLTRDRADRFALASQQRYARAWTDGAFADHVLPMSARAADGGWTLVTRDEQPRPDTTLAALAGLPTPFRPHGRVTAGNPAGLNDGATAALLTDVVTADRLGLEPKLRMVSFAFTGVPPETMGFGPVPATHKALGKAGLAIEDIGLIEINEAFAVQVLAFTDAFGLADDDARINPYGGAIAIGHPLAASGVRLMAQLAHGFAERPDVRYGLTTMCVGLGMGASVVWENPHHADAGNAIVTAGAAA